jgi:hypothetical protein
LEFGVATVTTIRLLGPGEAEVLDRVAEGVFDNPADPRWAAEFFAGPRHPLAVALDGGEEADGVGSAFPVRRDENGRRGGGGVAPGRARPDHRGQVFTRLALLGRRDLPDQDLIRPT